MTGTGTQSDPYIITTFADLFSTASGNYYKLGNDLDTNGTVYSGSWTSCALHGVEIDGDGHAIRNMSISGINAFTYSDSTICTIKNVKFENVIVTQQAMFMKCPNSPKIILKNCDFSIQHSSPDESIYPLTQYVISFDHCRIKLQGEYGLFDIRVLCGTSSPPATLNDCSVNIFVTVAKTLGQNTEYITSNRCDFTVNINAATITTGEYYGSILGRCNSCRVFGDISINSGYSSDYSIRLFEKANQCFVKCKITGHSMEYTRSNSGFNVYDDTVANGMIKDNATYNKGITTAQCKDADYLNSIGFFVVKEA